MVGTVVGQSQELPEQQRHAEERATSVLCHLRSSNCSQTGESPGLIDLHADAGTVPVTTTASKREGTASSAQSVFRLANSAAARRANNGGADNTTQTRPEDNHAAQKQKQYLFFETVNHARVLWEPTCKPKGILGGQLNIRSLISKKDQIAALLMD